MAKVKVQGMHCENCRKSVTEAVAGIPGVASVEVSLAESSAAWEDADAKTPVRSEAVIAAIKKIGFDAE